MPNYKQDNFKSPLEYNVYRYLKTKKNDVNTKYKIEYETEKLSYILSRNYVPDFILSFDDGRKIYIETKGYFRSEDRAKLLAVRDANPEVDLRILFAKDNKLNGKSRSRYSDWAKRHNFQYAIGTFPVEWFEE